DLESADMDAVAALYRSGGWPTTVFRTPEGEPFAGGTYFPPEPRHGMPAFRQVLGCIASAWREQREQVLESGQQLVAHIRSSASAKPVEGALGEAIFSAAYENLVL